MQPQTTLRQLRYWGMRTELHSTDADSLDTLYAKEKRQFFRDCEVYGTIDFIFGNAVAFFQNCLIAARPPLNTSQKTLVVTAQNRFDINGKEATVFQNCSVKAATPDFPATVKVFLGRPWGDFSKVVVMQSFLDSIIDPKGWLVWAGAAPRDQTANYNEYDNRGPGSQTEGRIKWPHYKILSQAEAREFTVRSFLQGDGWIPQTGIPVNLDLM